MKTALSLLELNGLVKDVVEQCMPDSYWVQAELSEARTRRGHCYMELIQKEEGSNTPVAKAKASCWASVWAIVRPHFERVTGQRLVAGMKVMLKVKAQFHENYGFSWIVTDIDPTFTLGDMERKRREIIEQLKAEGVLELNKELPLPSFTQSIAVISSDGAAGYGDFCRQLIDNDYGFCFNVRLFPAVMQGELVESSIISALNEINKRADEFDCVVIIRGGGATSDMSGFNTLALAENVANFPLPVITGIGHERDECIVDIVAHTNVKTPTAAAALLIDNLKKVNDRLNDMGVRLYVTVRQSMTNENHRIEGLARRVTPAAERILTAAKHRTEMLAHTLVPAAESMLTTAKHRTETLARMLMPTTERILTAAGHRLDMLEQRTAALDPKHILRRGYSITLLNGQAITDAKHLGDGDTIVTRFYKGHITSVIKKEKQNE